MLFYCVPGDELSLRTPKGLSFFPIWTSRSVGPVSESGVLEPIGLSSLTLGQILSDSCLRVLSRLVNRDLVASSFCFRMN